MSYESRPVWVYSRQRTFHPNKTQPHRGFVYVDSRRVYGHIELTSLGWHFFIG